MNENIDLTKILRDCPEGTEFWSDDYGKVEFFCIDTSLQHPIRMIRPDGNSVYYTKEGWCNINFPASCLLWPSKDCRDWSKFTAHWYKKEKFNPKTLQPYDKVLVRRGNENFNVWFPDFVSDPPNNDNNKTLCMCVGDDIAMVIPYNNDTKHLIGTTDEAPEYYKYWED